MLNSENLLNEAVRLIGGQRVDEIVGMSPNFSNADYIFHDENIVAETKSLEKDFLTADDVQEKLHRLHIKWVKEGKVPPSYGIVRISTDNLPKPCVYELIDVLRQPLKQHVKKASQQIKTVRSKLDMPDALGLLLLTNEGNFALDPEMTFHCLYHLLKTDYTGVESVVYCSANLVVPEVGTPWRVPPFYPVSFPGRRQPTDEFLVKLGTSWLSVLSKVTGVRYPSIGIRQGSREDIKDVSFVRR